MTVRREGDSRPDHTSSIVGEEGIPVKQDYDGTQIQRLGIAGADADWGPDVVDITDSEEKVAVPESVGGTSSFSGIAKSLFGENFSVVIVWTDGEKKFETIGGYEDCDNCILEEPPGVQEDFHNIIENVSTKSDNGLIFLRDESPEGTVNEVQFTFNFH